MTYCGPANIRSIPFFRPKSSPSSAPPKRRHRGAHGLPDWVAVDLTGGFIRSTQAFVGVASRRIPASGAVPRRWTGGYLHPAKIVPGLIQECVQRPRAGRVIIRRVQRNRSGRRQTGAANPRRARRTGCESSDLMLGLMVPGGNDICDDYGQAAMSAFSQSAPVKGLMDEFEENVGFSALFPWLHARCGLLI